jgi:hypothetical protein
VGSEQLAVGPILLGLQNQRSVILSPSADGPMSFGPFEAGPLTRL